MGAGADKTTTVTKPDAGTTSTAPSGGTPTAPASAGDSSGGAPDNGITTRPGGPSGGGY
jgi:hypothetical protein